MAGHDLFEVVFYYQRGADPDPDNDVIARTSWEPPRDAQIRGVYGKGKDDIPLSSSGVISYNYNAIWEMDEKSDSITEWVTDPEDPDGPLIPQVIEVIVTVRTSVLAQGEGAVTLFVGRKTDKTLLGIGKLTQVDGSSVLQITPDTKTVTFEVAALDCGVGNARYTVQPGEQQTSFLTNYYGNTVETDNTNRYKITLDGKQFDIFKLRDLGNNGDSLTSAAYHFRTNGARIEDYTNGIIVAGNGGYEKRQPRYPRANGGFQYFSVVLDDKTIISARNNRDIGSPFKTPVEVLFNTSYTDPGSLFAFAFEIPVCPLYIRWIPNPEPNTESDPDWPALIPDPNNRSWYWYIRPSFDSYWLDLDHGDGSSGEPKGAGGAVLLSTGSAAETSVYRIRVIVPPYKYLYTYHSDIPNHAGTPSPTDDPNNRYFNVNGLVVALEYDTGDNDIVRYLDISELNYEIGMKPIRPRDGPTEGDPIPAVLYGIQTVVVRYFYGGINHTDSFYIIVDKDTAGSYTNIPNNNYIVIDDRAIANSNLPGYLDVRLNTNRQGNNTFVIILDGNISVDFANATIIQSMNNTPNLVFVVAGRYSPSNTYGYNAVSAAAYENRARMGRTITPGSGATANGAFRVQGTANAFYFGKWPFNVELRGFGYGGGAMSTLADLPNGRRYSYLQTITGGFPGSPRNLHVTFNYTINAYGPSNSAETTTQEPQSGTSVTRAYFLRDGQGGRLYNVTVRPGMNEFTPGMNIINRGWLN